MIFSGLDLNFKTAICDPARHSLAGDSDALGQIGVRANHAAFAADDVSSLRGTLRRRAQGQELFLSRSIPLHGLCPTDLSRELEKGACSFDKGTFATSLALCRMVGRSPCTERYGCNAPPMYAAQRKAGTGWRSTRCCSAICARRLFTASWLNVDADCLSPEPVPCRERDHFKNLTTAMNSCREALEKLIW